MRAAVLALAAAGVVTGLVLATRRGAEADKTKTTGDTVVRGDLVDIPLPDGGPDAELAAAGVPRDATHITLHALEVSPTTVTGPIIGWRSGAAIGGIPPTAPITVLRSAIP